MRMTMGIRVIGGVVAALTAFVMFHSASADSTSPFRAIKVGMSYKEAKKTLGFKVEVKKTSKTFGPYIQVDHIEGEPANTLRRNLYFHDEVGLYRVLYVIGRPGGKLLPSKQAFTQFVELIKQAVDGKKVNVITQTTPSTNGLDLAELRECKSGASEIRESLAPLSIDEMREVLSSYNDYDRGMLAMHCGAISKWRYEFYVDDPNIVTAISIEPLTTLSAEIRMLRRDDRITRLMVSQYGQADPEG